MDAIVDASSLIVLARQDALWLLERIFSLVVLIPEVETETVAQGKARGYADAKRIEAAILHGALNVITPSTTEKRLATALGTTSRALSFTDCLTIVCAKERGLILVMEDQRARNAAIAEGVSYVTIQVLPLQAFLAKQVSFHECDDLLSRIGKAMRTDPAILSVFKAAAVEIDKLRSA